VFEDLNYIALSNEDTKNLSQSSQPIHVFL
jgi:hypothetical protein